MSVTKQSNILVIMGSVRPGRRCPQIADWVCDDEPSIPAKGGYVHKHTHAWSAKVTEADGVIIISPQYNWGYPAALKNALDHLYKEWSGKPLVIVTYGGHGGGKCAEQLRQVAGGLKMRPIGIMPSITLTHEEIQSDAPQSAEELEAFKAPLQQALVEFGMLLAEVGPTI